MLNILSDYMMTATRVSDPRGQYTARKPARIATAENTRRRVSWLRIVGMVF